MIIAPLKNISTNKQESKKKKAIQIFFWEDKSIVEY